MSALREAFAQLVGELRERGGSLDVRVGALHVACRLDPALTWADASAGGAAVRSPPAAGTDPSEREE
jgi:hypothetical protein